MSLQGPILIVAKSPDHSLLEAFVDAGAFPVVEASWNGAPTAAAEVKPAAIVLEEPGEADLPAARALALQVATAEPFISMIMQMRPDRAPPLPQALAVSTEATTDQLLARVSMALRLRTLHSTVIARAKSLRDERNIVAEPAAGDPLDDATVLLIGRGRHHATLSVAVGERMGVMGALSVEQGARCLNARELDGIVIGDGLPAYTVDAFLTLLAEDIRFRDLPVAVLGAEGNIAKLPNFVRALDPGVLIACAAPFVRMRARETALKRLIKSIESKGMINADTGLFNEAAFAEALSRAIADCAERGARLSLARFSFDEPLDRRTSLDAARLVSRLVRDADFACREDDGAILFVFGDTDLRDAHVAARRLASVLRHTMLGADRKRPSPSVTLATLKPTDTVHTLLARVAPRPVAAA
jgi:hypothetical protein